MRNILFSFGMLVPLLLVACTNEEKIVDVPPPPLEEVTNFISEEPDRIQVIKGEDVAIYAFRNEEEAMRVAEAVSPDASVIAGEGVIWAGERHLYLAGRAIAVYQGDNSTIIKALEKLYGSQFAGS